MRNYRGRDIFDNAVSICKRNAKLRNKEFKLSAKYLRGLWDGQEGRCNYTNVEFDILSRDNNTYPSLDRIDPNVGYVEGNVQ